MWLTWQFSCCRCRPHVLQCTDDSNYVGDYRRGKRHGYGVYSFPNGDQYMGEYEDDIPQVSGNGCGCSVRLKCRSGMQEPCQGRMEIDRSCAEHSRAPLHRSMLDNYQCRCFSGMPHRPQVAEQQSRWSHPHVLLLPSRATVCMCLAAASVMRATGRRAGSRAGASTQWRQVCDHMQNNSACRVSRAAQHRLATASGQCHF